MKLTLAGLIIGVIFFAVVVTLAANSAVEFIQ